MKHEIGIIFGTAHIRLIVKETYGWASESPARPAIPPPASSSVFQYALQATEKGQAKQLLHTRKWSRL